MKKFRMNRVLAVILALVMALALVACGGKGGDNKSAPKKTDEELIVGKWESKVDFGPVMEEAMKEAGDEAEMLKDVDFSGITMTINAEFKADGTYTLSMDKASGEAAMKQMVQKLLPALKEYFRQMMAEQSGGEVTDEMLDQMLALMGVDSWDALGEMLMENMDPEEMFEDTDRAGKYLIKDGKLFLSTDEDEDPAEAEGTEYKVSEKSLTIHAPQDEDEDAPNFMKELTFARIG